MMNDLITVKTYEKTPQAFRTLNSIRLSTAFTLFLAGILFFLYPALRPFSDETTLQGAAAFASMSWIVSHVLGIIAFIFLTLGLLGLYVLLKDSKVRWIAFSGFLLSFFGIGFTLPFYGAEVFALSAIGHEAINQNSDALLSLAGAIRFGPGLLMIFIGLILLAIGTILAAISIWSSNIMTKWCGIPLAIGFLLYIPQYTGTQPIRVTHGILVALGCIGIAVSVWRRK